MTSKEAIIIDKLYKTYQISDDVYKQIMSVIQYERKIEDVLDKIREEIKSIIDEEKAEQGNINKGVVIGLLMTLTIIDKYINDEEQERSEK